MKNVVAALGIVFSASALNIHAEVPQQLQQRFSAPGPAGKLTIKVSGECRGKLVYEAQDFTAFIQAEPNSSGHTDFSADLLNGETMYGSFYGYSTSDKNNFSIKKGKLNFEARSLNPIAGYYSPWMIQEDMQNIRCKNGQDMKTYIEENQGYIHSMPNDKTKLNQSLKISAKEAPYNYRGIIKASHEAHFEPKCRVNGDLTNGLQSNFYDAKCNQKIKITIKSNLNLKGRATPVEI